MPTVIPVKFRYAARDLWFNPKETGAQEADHVICTTERGTEIGICTADAREISEEELAQATNHAALKPIIRVATESDLNYADTLARKGDAAMPVFRRLVSQSDLDMKPVGVEYLFGGEKAVCYFSAEDRVDFRQLVRDLSHELHERIDMRQIGVREEAAVMGGYGHCGQELCCARFGLQFEPVSIRMAKEQDLPLNSSKISGACGRLMCCLRYEFEAYRDFKGRAPKRNAVIDTPLGKAKIVEYDTPKEEICLRIENGKQVRIPLAEMVASDAAKKKSEDLGCACRPDTVVRESLDKLNSPDIQMALAELDRKMGVTPANDSFDESDIFVEAKPRRRRRNKAEDGADAQGQRPQEGQARRRRGGQAQQASQGEGDSPESQAEPRTHRRRRRAGDAEASQQDAAQPRRRNNGDRGQDQGEKDQAQQAKPKSRGMKPRRRHHKAEGDATQQQGQSSQQSSKAQAPKDGQQPARHMRRPGDKGGVKAQQAQDGPAQQGRGTSSQKQQGDGSSKPRRRRRRGGRGRGGNGGDSGTSGSPE